MEVSLLKWYLGGPFYKRRPTEIMTDFKHWKGSKLDWFFMLFFMPKYVLLDDCRYHVDERTAYSLIIFKQWNYVSFRRSKWMNSSVSGPTGVDRRRATSSQENKEPLGTCQDIPTSSVTYHWHNQPHRLLMLLWNLLLPSIILPYLSSQPFSPHFW